MYLKGTREKMLVHGMYDKVMLKMVDLDSIYYLLWSLVMSKPCNNIVLLFLIFLRGDDQLCWNIWVVIMDATLEME